MSTFSGVCLLVCGVCFIVHYPVEDIFIHGHKKWARNLADVLFAGSLVLGVIAVFSALIPSR
jgi:ammonia channel protein AmtB